MSTSVHVFSESAVVRATPDRVYDVIADYREGHPRILPRPPFVDLAVLDGGVGDGTVLLVRMRILGRLQVFRTVVTEPEPGRRLVETNDTGYRTSFTVEPHRSGSESHVTITTEREDNGGVRARLERWLVERILRPAYREELRLLEAVARDQS